MYPAGMFVTVVCVTPATLAEIKKKPDVLEAVLFEPDEEVMKRLGISDADSAGFDYRIADDMMETVDEEADDDDGESDAVLKDLCADGSLDYDAGYGNAFTLSPGAVEKAIEGSSCLRLDDEVKALFNAAAKRGDHIIGVVS